MSEIIQIDEKEVFIKMYRVRPTGRKGRTLETSIPREVFEREARRRGLTVEEAVQKLVCVWRYNHFKGLHLTFEPVRKQENP